MNNFLCQLSETETTFNIFSIFTYSDPYPGKLISALYMVNFELFTNYNFFCIYLAPRILGWVLLHFGLISVQAKFITIKLWA